MLEETKFLACLGVVVRVEDFADRLGHVLLADRLLVTAAVEGVEIEFFGSLGFPEAEEIDRLGAVAGDGNVIRDTDDLAETDPDRAGVAEAVVHCLDMAVDWDLLLVRGADDFPRRAVLDPRVGKLDLVAVAEFLFEESVLVVDAVAHGGEVESGQRVEEAGGETPEAAIAQRHVVFLVAGVFEGVTKVVEGFVDLVEDPRGNHVVGKEAAHEELHGHVVDAADVLLVMDSEGFHHALDDDALDGHGGGNPPFPSRRCALVAGHGVF